jgi:hypothetical protein
MFVVRGYNRVLDYINIWVFLGIWVKSVKIAYIYLYLGKRRQFRLWTQIFLPKSGSCRMAAFEFWGMLDGLSFFTLRDKIHTHLLVQYCTEDKHPLFAPVWSSVPLKEHVPSYTQMCRCTNLDFNQVCASAHPLQPLMTECTFTSKLLPKWCDCT